MNNPEDPGVADEDEQSRHYEGDHEERGLGRAAPRVRQDRARAELRVVVKFTCNHEFKSV